MEFSFRATYQYGFVWIFVQYGFQYGYEFKSCPFKVILMSSWIFYHISHNVILFAVSFKATQVLSFQIQMSNWNFSCISQNEILLALSFKAMNFWKEFKFCFQIFLSNWIFCHLSNNGILFVLLFKATFQNGFLIWIQVLSFSN